MHPQLIIGRDSEHLSGSLYSANILWNQADPSFGNTCGIAIGASRKAIPDLQRSCTVPLDFSGQPIVYSDSQFSVPRQSPKYMALKLGRFVASGPATLSIALAADYADPGDFVQKVALDLRRVLSGLLATGSDFLCVANPITGDAVCNGGDTKQWGTCAWKTHQNGSRFDTTVAINIKALQADPAKAFCRAIFPTGGDIKTFGGWVKYVPGNEDLSSMAAFLHTIVPGNCCKETLFVAKIAVKRGDEIHCTIFDSAGEPKSCTVPLEGGSGAPIILDTPLAALGVTIYFNSDMLAPLPASDPDNPEQIIYHIVGEFSPTP